MHGGSTQVTHTSHTSLMAERELETFGSGGGRRRGEKHMAPTRLPRCVRRAKLLLRLATSPRVPSSGCISVLLSPSCSKQPPQIFILLQISIPTWLHSVCATFCHGKWGQQETLDSEGFAPEGKVVFPSCRRDFAGLYQEQEDATVF